MKRLLALFILSSFLFGQSYRVVEHKNLNELPNYVMKVNVEVLGFMLGETEEEMLRRFPNEMIERVSLYDCLWIDSYDCNCKCKTYKIDGNIAEGKSFSYFEVVVVIRDSSSYVPFQEFPNLVYSVKAVSYINDFGEELCIDRFNAFEKELSRKFIIESEMSGYQDDDFYYLHNRDYRSFGIKKLRYGGRKNNREFLLTLINDKPIDWKIFMSVSKHKSGNLSVPNTHSDFTIFYVNKYLEDYYEEKKYLLY